MISPAPSLQNARSDTSAYGCLVTTMALWGGSLVVARGVHELIGPMALTFWRWVVALVILWPLVRRKLPGAMPFIRRHWRGLGLLSVLMILGSTLSVVAVNFTTATNATLVNAVQPALTALVGWLLVRERLTVRQGVGIAFAFSGIVVMVFRGDIGVLLGLGVNGGDLLMLCAVTAWASYAVNLHRLRYPLDADVVLFLIAVVAVPMMLPLYAIEAATSGGVAASSETVGAIVYLGGGATVLAVYLWNRSIATVGANRAAIFVNLIPVFGASLATFLLGERLARYHLVGASLVFVGIVLAAGKAWRAVVEDAPVR